MDLLPMAIADASGARLSVLSLIVNSGPPGVSV